MAELYAVRDRKGNLTAYTTDRIIKNNGGGYWLPEFNVKTTEIKLNNDDFPEIDWDDLTPTRLELVNPLANNVVNIVKIPGTIEVTTSSSCSQYSIDRGGDKFTVFVNDISYIEPTITGNFKSILHMKNGDKINCKESVNEVGILISNVT